MNKITFKIAIPIILTGLFAIIVFIATGYGKLDQGFYIVFLVFSVYIFLFGVAIGENLSSPIRKLIQRATQLSEGDLKTRIYLETKDEFGELSKIFNKIAEDLEESKIANVRTEESIDIKVKARTKALEETISALEQKVKNRTIELEKIAKELEIEKQLEISKEAGLESLKQEVEKLKSSQSKSTSKKTKTATTQTEPVVDIKPEE